MPNLTSISRSDIVFSSRIPSTLRTQVLACDEEITCHMCGIGPGERDSFTGLKARLRIDYHSDKRAEETGKISDLEATCSICNQGAKNITSEKPTTIWLLSQIRRAGQDEQRAVLKWLREKFKE